MDRKETREAVQRRLTAGESKQAVFLDSASRTNTRRNILLMMLGIATIGFAINQTYPEAVREYRLYLTEERPDLSFRFDELSEDWSEADLIKHFEPVHFACYTNAPGKYLDERSCFADIHSFNHAPAMTASFFFANGRLNRASVIIPSWAHRDQLRQLVKDYDRPSARQPDWQADVPLYGWTLPGHGALFYNRHRPLNPLLSNGIFWSSEKQCALQSCFTP